MLYTYGLIFALGFSGKIIKPPPPPYVDWNLFEPELDLDGTKMVT